MKKQNLTTGKRLKAQLESETEYNKFKVAVDIYLKDHLVISPELFCFFRMQTDGNFCHNEFTGKKVNLGKGEELQIPCPIYLTREEKYFNKLKDTLFS